MEGASVKPGRGNPPAGTGAAADERVDAFARAALRRAASALQAVFFPRRTRTDYTRRLRNRFTRGYLVGCFDAALRCAHIPVADEAAFFELMVVGHTLLLDGDAAKARIFVLESLAVLQDEACSTAMRTGNSEYRMLLEGRIQHPATLETFFGAA